MSNNPRQTVGAAVRINEDTPILNIDGSTVLNSNGMIYTNGAGSRSGSALIDAISAISSTDIKTTTITFRYEFGSPTIHRDNFTQSTSGSGEITITIDWVGLEAIWSGLESYGGGTDINSTTRSIWSGKSTIQTTGSSINLLSVSGQTGYTLHSGKSAGTLVTGANKKILGLPIAMSQFRVSRWGSGSSVFQNYTITTDTGITVVAAPEPPAADVVTVTQEVSGIKISELNAADSLNDTDLFVLSRDQPADGPYDESLNVTLENLKAGIGPPSILQTVAWANFNGTEKPDGSAIGATGPCKIKDSATITSIEKESTGTYRITLSQTMASDNYCVVGTTGRQDSGAGTICLVEVGELNADNFTLITRLINTGGVPVDQSYMGFVVMGELQA